MDTSTATASATSNPTWADQAPAGVEYALGTKPAGAPTIAIDASTGVVTLTVDEAKKVENGTWQYPVTATASGETTNATVKITISGNAAAPTTYAVTVDSSIENGTLEATPNEDLQAGALVTVTATPEKGYRLSAAGITVTPAAGITVTPAAGVTVEMDGNTGTFLMPAANVTVSAKFEEIPAFTVTVTPDQWSVTSGSAQQAFTAVVTDANGKTVTNQGQITWALTAPTGQSVPAGLTIPSTAGTNPSSKVTARFSGTLPETAATATLTATFKPNDEEAAPVNGTATIAVSSMGTKPAITTSPQTATDNAVSVGFADAITLTAKPDGNVPITPSGSQKYQWTVKQGATGTPVVLDASNQAEYGVEIGGANSSTLTFTPENAGNSAVSDPGANLVFTCQLVDAAGNALTAASDTMTVTVADVYIFLTADPAGIGRPSAPITYAGLAANTAASVTLQAVQDESNEAPSGMWSLNGQTTVKITDLIASGTSLIGAELPLQPAASVPAGNYEIGFLSDSGASATITVEIRKATVTVDPTSAELMASQQSDTFTAGMLLPGASEPSEFAAGAGTWTVTDSRGNKVNTIAIATANASTTTVMPRINAAAGTYTLTYTLGTGASAPKATATITVTAVPTSGDLTVFASAEDSPTAVVNDPTVIKGSGESLYLNAIISNGKVSGGIPDGDPADDAVWTLPVGTNCAYWGLAGTGNTVRGASQLELNPPADTLLEVNQTYTFTCTTGSGTNQQRQQISVTVQSPAALSVAPQTVTIPLGLDGALTASYTPAGKDTAGSVPDSIENATWTVIEGKTAAGTAISNPAGDLTFDPADDAVTAVIPVAGNAVPGNTYTVEFSGTDEDGNSLSAEATVVISAGTLTIDPAEQTVNIGMSKTLTAKVNGKAINAAALVGQAWSVTQTPQGVSGASNPLGLSNEDTATLTVNPTVAGNIGDYTVEFALGSDTDAPKATAKVTVAAQLPAGTLYMNPETVTLNVDNPQARVTPAIAGSAPGSGTPATGGSWTLPEGTTWSQWNSLLYTDTAAAPTGAVTLNPAATILDGDYTFTYEMPDGQKATCTVTVDLGHEPIETLVLTADPASLTAEAGATIKVTASYEGSETVPSGTWTSTPSLTNTGSGATFTAVIPEDAEEGATYAVTFTDTQGVPQSKTVTFKVGSTTPPAPTEYALTIEPANSGVTTNPADTSALTAGTRVTLTTAADAVLSASAGTLQATNATTWTLTMPASNVTVTVTTLETGEVAVVQPAQAPVTTIPESEAQGGNTVGIRSTMSYNRQTQQFNALLYLPAVKGSADAEPTIALDTSKGQSGQIVDANYNPLEVTWSYANGMWTAEPSLVMLINFNPRLPIDIVVTTEGDYTFKDTNSNAVDVDTGDEEAMVKYAPAMIPPAISFS